MAAEGEISESGIEELAAIVQAGLDSRGPGIKPGDVSVQFAETLPGGRRFLWLECSGAVGLMVRTGELTSAGARRLTAVLADRLAGGEWAAMTPSLPAP